MFRLMPWDVDRITHRLFLAYCSAVDEIEREASKDG